MATTSFSKKFIINEPEAIQRFIDIISDETPRPPVNRELASDENMKRGREVLKQYLSESSN
jgi:hypothetical protein